jgi:hypothetical protein
MAAKAQRTGHLLRENEVWKVLKSHKFMFGALIPTVSNSEGQVKMVIQFNSISIQFFILTCYFNSYSGQLQS